MCPAPRRVFSAVVIANPLVTPSSPKHATAARRRLRRRRGLLLGPWLRCSPARHQCRRLALRAGSAPLLLAGPGAPTLRRRQRLSRPGRHRMGPRVRLGAVRRASARAVKLSRLRLCPARPRRRHSALMRGTRRHAAGAVGLEGAVAGTPHRRRARDGRGPLHHRHRSIAHHRRPRHRRRSPVRQRPADFLPPSACWCGCGG